MSSEDEETKDESIKKQREITALRQQLDGLLRQALLPKGGFTTFFTRSLFYDPNRLSEEISKASLNGPATKGKSKGAQARRRKGGRK